MLNDLMQKHTTEMGEMASAISNNLQVIFFVGLGLGLLAAVIAGIITQHEAVGLGVFAIALSVVILIITPVGFSYLNQLQDKQEATGEELRTLLSDEYALEANEAETAMLDILSEQEITAEDNEGSIIKISIEEYNDEFHLFSDGTMLEPVN